MNNQSGYTLIEAMIALVILAIGLAGILGFSATAIIQSRDNDKWTEARLIAESELEKRSAVSLNWLDTIVGTPAATAVSTVTHNNTTYQVTTWHSPPVAGQYRISVQVSYPGALLPVTFVTEKNAYL